MTGPTAFRVVVYEENIEKDELYLASLWYVVSRTAFWQVRGDSKTNTKQGTDAKPDQATGQERQHDAEYKPDTQITNSVKHAAPPFLHRRNHYNWTLTRLSFTHAFLVRFRLIETIGDTD